MSGSTDDCNGYTNIIKVNLPASTTPAILFIVARFVIICCLLRLNDVSAFEICRKLVLVHCNLNVTNRSECYLMDTRIQRWNGALS